MEQFICYDLSLRNRVQFLMSFGTVLRSESLFKADLCDLFDFIMDTEIKKEPSSYHILVLGTGEGKQNNDKYVFWRIMKYFDPRLCGIYVNEYIFGILKIFYNLNYIHTIKLSFHCQFRIVHFSPKKKSLQV